MKTLLMYRDRDFDMGQELPWNEPALTQDLELKTLITAMAAGDKFLFEVAQKALFAGLRTDVETVLYRQAVLKDCLDNANAVRKLYSIAAETIEKRSNWWLSFSSRSPSGILSNAIRVMEIMVDGLKKLRIHAEANAHLFRSEGFSVLFATLQRETSDEYLASIRNHLNELRFPRGTLLSSEVGEGNESANYVLRLANGRRTHWLLRVFGRAQPGYTFRLHPRDEAGARILSGMVNNGINLAANALAQSADHVESFFRTLKTELAFYIGCLNLHDQLTSHGSSVCFPTPVSAGERKHRFSGLYDVCLSLVLQGRGVVDNAADADGRNLVIITGANQGGKSVFLRSIGLAQIMMQCGMFVTAKSFQAELCEGLLTHYKREEDATMQRGKLDEELARMSGIVDHLAPHSMLLCNESFAATNDREGSEIARQIVCALLENRVKVFFVTHLYDFAQSLSAGEAEGTLFMRAERKPDGTRTFKLVEGKPLDTSYGEDLYRQVFAGAQVTPDERESR